MDRDARAYDDKRQPDAYFAFPPRAQAMQGCKDPHAFWRAWGEVVGRVWAQTAWADMFPLVDPLAYPHAPRYATVAQYGTWALEMGRVDSRKLARLGWHAIAFVAATAMQVLFLTLWSIAYIVAGVTVGVKLVLPAFRAGRMALWRRRILAALHAFAYWPGAPLTLEWRGHLAYTAERLWHTWPHQHRTLPLTREDAQAIREVCLVPRRQKRFDGGMSTFATKTTHTWEPICTATFYDATEGTNQVHFTYQPRVVRKPGWSRLLRLMVMERWAVREAQEPSTMDAPDGTATLPETQEISH